MLKIKNMTKNSVFVVFSLLLSLSAKAQTSFGLTLGGSFTPISVVNSSGADVNFIPENSAPTYQLGVYGQTRLSNKWDIRAGLLYSPKSYTSVAFTAKDTVESYKPIYVGLPVSIGYEFSPNWKVRVGGSFQYCIKKDFLVDNAFDYGVLGEVSYSFKKLDLTLGYNRSLNQFTRFDYTGGHIDFKNQSFYLNLSVPIFKIDR